MENLTNGAFESSLKRNNKQIRDDRAASITRTTQLAFKRNVEDIEMEIEQLDRDRESMLDLSPTTATSLTLASDFNAQEFLRKDMEMGIKRRELVIKLSIAKERLAYLFGSPKTTPTIESEENI